MIFFLNTCFKCDQSLGTHIDLKIYAEDDIGKDMAAHLSCRAIYYFAPNQSQEYGD